MKIVKEKLTLNYELPCACYFDTRNGDGIQSYVSNGRMRVYDQRLCPDPINKLIRGDGNLADGSIGI